MKQQTLDTIEFSPKINSAGAIDRYWAGLIVAGWNLIDWGIYGLGLAAADNIKHAQPVIQIIFYLDESVLLAGFTIRGDVKCNAIPLGWKTPRYQDTEDEDVPFL